ncbi:hypothetical protein BASA81_018114, partial [Batrachochytrium salamandrivorans]
MSTFWSVISVIVGWTYFAAWSFSFYPQVLLNYSNKSVQGLSFEFVYLNVTGFLCYAIYTLAFYAIPLARTEYRDKWGSDIVIQLNDVVFALHALALSSITLLQTIAWRHRSSPPQQLAAWAKLFLLAVVLGASIIMGAIVVSFSNSDIVHSFVSASASGHTTNRPQWQFITLLEYLASVKMAITLIKYTPQAVLNFQRKSTAGWSINNVLLDLTGGVLSLVQLAIDTGCPSDWIGITGNPTKFGLGTISILFDLFFMYQYYVLYPNRHHVSEDTVDTDQQQLLIDENIEIAPDPIESATGDN